MKKRILLGAAAMFVLTLMAWGSFRLRNSFARNTPPATNVPVTKVKRSDVKFTVTARGELLGGNSEMLAAPMTGGNEMAITFLRDPGELVKEGEVVVGFDTTEQEFKLKEAEADLSEAEQQVAQAKAESEAKDEETRYALAQAKSEVKLAELEARRNPLLAAIVARQNELALSAAEDKLRQLQQDSSSRKATNEAGIAIQEAALNKAKVKADTARKNINAMTLKAHSPGYVSVQQNTNGNFMFFGMQLPMLQVGDTVRAGMGVAQIPDLHNWEASARIGELDRGHLAEGQKTEIGVVALPGKTFSGRIKSIGGTTGPPWDRHSDFRITLESPSPELRPGMTVNIVITTEVLQKALWVPAQAVFESDGRAFVHLRTASGFTPTDVKLVQRSESQVVVSGLAEGQIVAMADPTQQNKKKGAGGALQALSK